MEDFTNLTQEQIFAAEAYFNLATMVGKCLEISVYQLDHPDYKPRVFVSDSVNEEAEEEEETAPHTSEPTPISSGRIRSNELSELAQMHQLFCLYDERIRDILGPSSLYEMFRLASSLFSYEFKSPDEEPSPLDRKKIAVAWVIVKRTFAINHMQEALHLLNLPDVLAGDLVYKTQPVGSPMDRQDELFITAACKLCEGVVFGKIPLEQVIDNALRALEKEKKAERVGRLAPLSSVPNGEALGWLYRVVSNGNRLRSSNSNRHEVISKQDGRNNSVRYIRTNKQTGNTYTVEIAQADKYLSKTSKTFKKLLLFSLQKLAAQNEPVEVGFQLQELVELGMYTTTSNAIRGIKEFFAQQKQTMLSGTLKKGKKTIREEGGILFYHYHIENGFVKLSVNENFNLDFITNYYTVFPRFAYALSNNAFSLVRYIFFVARQNKNQIKDKGTFTVSLDSVRENLGLPAPDEVRNRKYKQYIIDPIETAIEEIETALQEVPEAKEYGFTITPICPDTSNINKWLEGYLEIGLKGDFAETFIDLATKAEAQREKWSRIKTAELAKLAAKKEAAESAN